LEIRIKLNRLINSICYIYYYKKIRVDGKKKDNMSGPLIKKNKI